MNINARTGEILMKTDSALSCWKFKPYIQKRKENMNSSIHKSLIGFVILLSVLCPLSSVFPQGSLIPPGPPGPTMKTLDEIDAKLEKRTPISSLPYTISASGSYYLTQNLTTSGSGGG